MQFKLRVVEEHRWRGPWLKQCSSKANEAKRAIGELIGKKRVIGILLQPFELNQIGIGWHWAQLKIIEKWSCKPHNITNLVVATGTGLADSISECGHILCVEPQYF